MAPPVFPTLKGITFPVKRGVRWSGTKQDALSGKRVRTSYYSYPIYLYEVMFNFLRTGAAFTEWQQLAGFVNQLNGAANLFLYDDVNDDTATAAGFGTGDGVTTKFQLTRSLGGFVEPVFFPNVITDVKVAGAATGAYTLPGLGIVQFNSAPVNGAALTWDGTFYWPCRFDLDDYGFENFMSQLFELKSLKFSTEKLP